jgi:hypothetical protein
MNGGNAQGERTTNVKMGKILPNSDGLGGLKMPSFPQCYFTNR